MDGLLPWLRVGLGVLVYLCIAVAASIATRRLGSNLKEMGGRTSNVVLLVGLVANLGVLSLILLMVVAMDHQSLRALGIAFSGHDLAVVLLSVVLIGLMAAAFLKFLSDTSRICIQDRSMLLQTEMLGMFTTVVVLFVVALQEEVLFRLHHFESARPRLARSRGDLDRAVHSYTRAYKQSDLLPTHGLESRWRFVRLCLSGEWLDLGRRPAPFRGRRNQRGSARNRRSILNRDHFASH